MRDGWRRVTLGDIADALVGPAFKSNLFSRRKSDIRLARGTNVGPGALRWDNEQRWPQYLGAEFARYALREGDTVIAMDATFTSGGPIRAAVVSPSDLPALLVQRVARLRSLDGVDPQFVSLVVASTRFGAHLRARQTGAFAPHVSLSDIRTYSVDLPPLDEQRRIVDLVDAADAQIEAVRLVEQRAARARRSLAFELVARNDATHEMTTVGEVSSFAGGYAFPRARQGSMGGGTPFLKVSDMNAPGNEITITRANNHVDADDLIAMRARSWPEGTVVFPKVGAALLTEKRRILGERAAFDNNIMGLVPGSRIAPTFLLAVMETVRLGAVAQSGAVPSINQKHVAAIPISLPPRHEQERVVQLLAEADRFVAEARRVGDAADALRVALVSVLLDGTLTIPAPYDRFLEAT